ncbi:mitochondrial F1F0-ATP synthase-like protein g subunit [Dothidotthia symphoricarpi CBS 119687]|uniref:Mitochondrial F1F0-ATP synthase-like protein g subunit n=1 Tax=Dothidotthia symphoricarpi CBS 119687 TaxID=1392245 RepID=A0A6A6A7W9_9PLEO|nr:mitochondrial F1F0-ATP synthase-like protein g subunit [Dothidotthia symphoricarpi CBS 119687]KAF2128082.1 mitochondrial F1F0-ATP synthase-like protein g subunit [Dothidotthia symphoricarpi CBS 119687]
MSLAASRAVLRQSTFAVRRAGIRNASTTSETAGAAKDKVASKASEASSKASDVASKASSSAKEASSTVQSKASEGLSKVTSSAGAAMSKAGDALNSAANSAAKVGGRTGRLVGRIQGLVPQTIYYSKVALELGRLVVQQRSMAPPSIQTMQNYMQPALNSLKNPSALLNRAASSGNAQPANMLSQVRNMSSAQWTSVGIVAAEVIGFFSIGEAIGRFKLVGYRVAEPAHH